MDVIDHQAIGQNLNLIFTGVLAQPIQIGVTIFIGEEHRVATVAALRDVMWDPGEYAAR
jgi:hypothetical protein